MIVRRSFYEAFPVLERMGKANHEATEHPGEYVPQWSILEQLEQSGALCVLVAVADGVAVGYCIHAAMRSHVTGELHATCLAIYLEPAYRGMAKALVREAERHAKEAGCAAILFSVPHLSTAGAFFETVCGYECRELVMEKRI